MVQLAVKSLTLSGHEKLHALRALAALVAAEAADEVEDYIGELTSFTEVIEDVARVTADKRRRNAH